MSEITKVIVHRENGTVEELNSFCVAWMQDENTVNGWYRTQDSPALIELAFSILYETLPSLDDLLEEDYFTNLIDGFKLNVREKMSNLYAKVEEGRSHESNS